MRKSVKGGFSVAKRRKGGGGVKREGHYVEGFDELARRRKET